MKFKGPEGTTSISVGGECFNVGDDGMIETPDNGNYASLLAPHGFEVHVVEAAAAEQTKAETAAEKKAREKAEKLAAEAAAAEQTKAPE